MSNKSLETIGYYNILEIETMYFHRKGGRENFGNAADPVRGRFEKAASRYDPGQSYVGIVRDSPHSSYGTCGGVPAEGSTG